MRETHSLTHSDNLNTKFISPVEELQQFTKTDSLCGVELCDFVTLRYVGPKGLWGCGVKHLPGAKPRHRACKDGLLLKSGEPSYMPPAVPGAFSLPDRPYFEVCGVHDRNEGLLESGIFRMQICKGGSAQWLLGTT